MSIAAGYRVRETPKELALDDGDLSLTWEALNLVLNRAINRLHALGVEPGDRVGVYANNSAEAVVAYLASILGGASVVPINAHLTSEELDYILRRARPKLLFVGPETAPAAVEVARVTGGATVVGWRSALDDVESWETFLDAGAPSEPRIDFPPAPQLHFTSGTTGRPKAVETPPTIVPRLSTISDYVAFLATRADVARLSPNIVVGPLYHAGPLAAVRAVLGGTTLIVMRRFDAEGFLAAVAQHGVQSAAMSPVHFERLLALPPSVRNKYDVSSVRLITHTGSACQVETKRRMIDWFGPVFREFYGATEAGITNAIDTAEWLRKPGSVGRTLSPYEPVIVSEEGLTQGANVQGVIYFKDTTGRGVIYDGDAEATAKAHIAPGVFTLGDVGFVDEEGYLFITDRASDMIISGGVNIYPAEIEQVLLAHEAVADVAVIGVPHPEMGEAVKALIVPKPDIVAVDFDALSSFCRSRLAGFKCPRSYELRPEIERNAFGKINKRELRKPYWTTAGAMSKAPVA
ncbi:AMP-binding protein [Brevundimonas sp.]|uniref:AMP-binding protein n=1 Tax=Brevundimonas sp. TaxID=1871086 RepID=UPI00289B1749|nr:AMP-binding protein [Brevundimonas sp.]